MMPAAQVVSGGAGLAVVLDLHARLPPSFASPWHARVCDNSRKTRARMRSAAAGLQLDFDGNE